MPRSLQGGPAARLPAILLPALLVWGVLASCSSGGSATSTVPVTTISLTTGAPTTSTTIGEVEVTVAGCSTPPVTFALLCEVVELVESHHVEPPDQATLALAATRGVRTFQSDETEPLPRGITCAIPGPEFVALCQAVEERLEADQVPLAPLIESAVSSMLIDTVDPYTMYIPPELSGAVGEDGIIPGLSMVVGALTAAGSPCVRVEDSCPLQVIAALSDGPADIAGVEAGDIVERVNGAEIRGRTVIEIAGMMGGEAGTTLILEVRRGGNSIELELVRADSSTLPISIEMVGSTGYVRLPEFGVDAHLFFHLALETLIESGASRLVLDLRDNPGGYLFSVSIIGSEFFSSGLLYKTAGPLESLDYPAVEGGIATSIPVITLVNGSSASAAEILASVLQERDRSVIVGVPTFGKNLVQHPFELRNGGFLRVTTARWTTPNGASVRGTGVVPDVLVEFDSDLAIPDLVEAAISAAT